MRVMHLFSLACGLLAVALMWAALNCSAQNAGAASAHGPTGQTSLAAGPGVKMGESGPLATLASPFSPRATPTPGITPTSTPTCVGPSPWQNESTMTVPHAFGAGVVANDTLSDKFYVISGASGSSQASPAEYKSAVERFDPATGTWANMPPIIIPGTMMQAASIGMRIYVPGGYNPNARGVLQTMQVYYSAPQYNYWIICPHPPVEAVAAEGVAACNSKVYMIGGVLGDGSATNHVWEHDPYANTYTAKAPLPVTESYLGAVTLGGLIYVFGGHSRYVSYAFDPIANTWTALAPGPTPNFQAPGVFALNGEVWVVGGSDENGNPYPPGLQVHIYNPAANSWRLGPPLNTPRVGSSAAGAINARGYVAGGINDANSYLNSAESVTYLPCGTATITPQPTSTGTLAPSATRTAGPTCTATPLPSDTAIPVTPTRPVATATATPTGTAGPPGETPVPTGTPAPPFATSTPCPILFLDVPSDDTFYPYVRCLACRGILGGYNDGTFRPGNNITRGQIAKIVSNAAALQDDIAGRQTYADVPSSQTFWQWIERLTVRGVMVGYPCGGAGEPCDEQNRPYFRPGSNATRGQLSKIVSNAAGFGDDPAEQIFADVAPSHTFYTWVQRLAGRAIVGGYPCGGAGEPCDGQNRPYFRPESNVTRGQAAKIVANAFFSDCSMPGGK